jgi:hypothetical protein
MRRHVERAHGGHERSRVVALVASKGDAANTRRMAHDRLFGALRSAVPVAFVTVAATTSPLRFSISAWPMKLSLASLPGPLR